MLIGTPLSRDVGSNGVVTHRSPVTTECACSFRALDDPWNFVVPQTGHGLADARHAVRYRPGACRRSAIEPDDKGRHMGLGLSQCALHDSMEKG
jgi:hypothetical protein